MADIFISYSSEDRDQARILAAFLEAEGYSVWWDTGVIPSDPGAHLRMPAALCSDKQSLLRRGQE
jgi:hypothetical protein